MVGGGGAKPTGGDDHITFASTFPMKCYCMEYFCGKKCRLKKICYDTFRTKITCVCRHFFQTKTGYAHEIVYHPHSETSRLSENSWGYIPGKFCYEGGGGNSEIVLHHVY